MRTTLIANESDVDDDPFANDEELKDDKTVVEYEQWLFLSIYYLLFLTWIPRAIPTIMRMLHIAPALVQAKYIVPALELYPRVNVV